MVLFCWNQASIWNMTWCLLLGCRFCAEHTLTDEFNMETPISHHFCSLFYRDTVVQTTGTDHLAFTQGEWIIGSAFAVFSLRAGPWKRIHTLSCRGQNPMTTGLDNLDENIQMIQNKFYYIIKIFTNLYNDLKLYLIHMCKILNVYNYIYIIIIVIYTYYYGLRILSWSFW